MDGLLDVGDGHQIWWEVSGNPAGRPAVVLHGGPGSGSRPSLRDWFDPAAYRVVRFDQRNCGRSRPHAADPVVDLSTNTTQHLVSDMERLREHLGVDRWLGRRYLVGHHARPRLRRVAPGPGHRPGAQQHRHRHQERDRLADPGDGPGLPREWAAFVEGVPAADRDGDLAAAYHRLLMDPDPAVHEPAAAAWCAWEDTHVGTYVGHRPNPRYEDPRFRLCFARIVTHYFSHAGFLEDGQLMRDALRLKGIPGVMVQGAMDISSPPDIAWQLSRRWPESELVLLADTGHGATLEAVRAATDRLA